MAKKRGIAEFLVLACLFSSAAWALAPEKRITQYTRTDWTQADGLPQDTVRAIAQTADGYLWLATDEGLARFDGYDFLVFSKERGDLPDNSVTSLAPGNGNELWIGTAAGLIRYRNRHFERVGRKQGLPDGDVAQVLRDRNGVIWVVTGFYLARIDSAGITSYRSGADLPLASVRTVYEDSRHNLWIAGLGGLARLAGGKFISVLDGEQAGQGAIQCLAGDHAGNLWIGSNILRMRSADGRVRTWSESDGMRGRPIRAVQADHDDNVWVGTSDGFNRFYQGKFEPLTVGESRSRERVRSLFEDSEGNLWMGTNNGLSRFLDNGFTVYTKNEGMPSDQATAVFQDHSGAIWLGFRNAGLARLRENEIRSWNSTNSPIDDYVYSIHESPGGDLLLATRSGFMRMRKGVLSKAIPAPGPQSHLAFDALEDRSGHVWIANSDGLSRLGDDGRFNIVLPGGVLPKEFLMVLCEGLDGVIWVASRGNGLWRYQNGTVQHLTTADGLSNNQVRALQQDDDGTLWIGTFGGGLNRLKNGRFFHYTTAQGLPSNNIFHIDDDHRGSYWLSTTRGVSRVPKSQLDDLADGKTKTLPLDNFGVEDGLLSAQCGAGYPFACEAAVTKDGRYWFPTGIGIAVLDPAAIKRRQPPAPLHLVEMTVGEKPVDMSAEHKFAPGASDIQIRYAAVHLSSPESIQYSYQLEGIDRGWVPAGKRRNITYNNLSHGNYRFVVRSEIKNGPASEESYDFEVLPHFYELLWFRILILVAIGGLVLLAYRRHLAQIRGRFTLVLEERARIARELHDTLAQSFVGISSQLDALDTCLAQQPEKAREFLDLARGMSRHSLNEARRTLMDLRASALEGRNLSAALEAETRRWTAGSSLEVHVDVAGDTANLPREIEQNMLRIAQEAVINTLKHAGAASVWVILRNEAQHLHLRVHDDGRGCLDADLSSPAGGHFGLIGMRERAQSIGGEFRFQSAPQAGTLVEVTVPLN